MTKMGFYFNQTMCIGCKACQIACKDKNDNQVGTTFRSVTDYEIGSYPDVASYHISATCNHCENPACVAVCPNLAMYVDSTDGTVQHVDNRCIGCKYCVEACPYHVPQYMTALMVVHKCDACITLREAGERNACVAACPTRALDFGPLEELAEKYPSAVRDIAARPDSTKTSPATLIEARPAALVLSYRQVRM